MDDQCDGALMKEKEVVEVRQRWVERPIDLRKALQGGESPFGQTVNGLKDFRGVSINQSLHRIAFSRVDLSYSEMDEGQLASEVEDCVFDGCRFESNLGKRFLNCSFAGSRLANSILRGTFRSCSFDDANLNSVRCSQAIFEGCSFVSTALRRASFFDCTFDRCDFKDCKLGSGSFAGSRFKDCVFSGVSFSRTIVERVSGLPTELL
jgi:uncharacterized protein YjbI with pentapeptide repeats